MSEEKIFFMSFVFLIGMNILVVPLIGEETGEIGVPNIEPPESSFLSPDYDRPSIFDGWREAVTGIGQWIVGVFTTILYVVQILGTVLFGGSFEHPFVALVNLVLTIVALVSFLKILPTT